MIYLSIDDVFEIWCDLKNKENKYKSIFQNKTLAFLKKINTKLGTKITLFCFYEGNGIDLTQISNKWKKQFILNSKWLKFGFHGRNDKVNYNTASYSRLIRDYQLFEREIIRFAGKECVSKDLKLHFFSGNYIDIINLMKTNNLDKLICADDNRISYGLPKRKLKLINKNYELNEDGIKYCKSLKRYEDTNIVFSRIQHLIYQNILNDCYCYTHEKQLKYSKIRKRIVKWEKKTKY